MIKTRLHTRRAKQIALLAGVAALFFIFGIAILLASKTSNYSILSTLSFIAGMTVLLAVVLEILFKSRSTVKRMRTQVNNLTKRLASSQAIQKEMAENLRALTASQTRLWDEFERSNNP